MDDDGLPHLRNSLRQGPALRVAQLTPQPAGRIEGPQPIPAAPAAPRSSFWRFIAARNSDRRRDRIYGGPRLFPDQPALATASADADAAAASCANSVATARSSATATASPGSGAAQQQSEVQEPDPPVPNPLPPMPSDDKLLILINSALIALNQANATGNYTVLCDMAAPGFQTGQQPRASCPGLQQSQKPQSRPVADRLVSAEAVPEARDKSARACSGSRDFSRPRRNGSIST